MLKLLLNNMVQNMHLLISTMFLEVRILMNWFHRKIDCKTNAIFLYLATINLLNYGLKLYLMNLNIRWYIIYVDNKLFDSIPIGGDSLFLKRRIKMDDIIKDLFKNYLKIIDNYVVPFLRSQNGFWVVIILIVFLIVF